MEIVLSGGRSVGVLAAARNNLMLPGTAQRAARVSHRTASLLSESTYTDTDRQRRGVYLLDVAAPWWQDTPPARTPQPPSGAPRR